MKDTGFKRKVLTLLMLLLVIVCSIPMNTQAKKKKKVAIKTFFIDDVNYPHIELTGKSKMVTIRIFDIDDKCVFKDKYYSSGELVLPQLKKKGVYYAKVNSSKSAYALTRVDFKTKKTQKSATKKKAVLQWNAMRGATFYEVYKQVNYNGKWKLVGTTHDCSYTVSGKDYKQFKTSYLILSGLVIGDKTYKAPMYEFFDVSL